MIIKGIKYGGEIITIDQIPNAVTKVGNVRIIRKGNKISITELKTVK